LAAESRGRDVEVFEGIGTGLLVALGALVLVQVTLQVIAIVQLVKTPAQRVSIGGRKWVWALIILLGQIVGPLIWFFLGRTTEPTDVDSVLADESVRRSAVDTLYGEKRE
jgi:Mn2+/Fe2+ NRAMP family transporter